jgi:hypothetical protein
MPIFGQVWLWSLLAFVIGALVTWVLLVLPIRKRIDALERRLASVRAEKAATTTAPERQDRQERQERYERPVEPPPPPALQPSASSIVPGFGEQQSDDEIRAESLTRAYAMPGLIDTPLTPPIEEAEERGALQLSGEPPAEATEYIGSQGTPLVAPRMPAEEPAHGWFEDEREPAPRTDHHLVDDEEDDDRGTIFTQRTTPIPAELIRELDESSRHAEPAPPKDDSLVDDLEDEPEEPPAPRSPAPQPAFSGADTVIVHKNGALPTELRREPEPEPVPEPVPAPEPVRAPEPVTKEERVSVAANNKNTMRAPIIELNKPLELDRTQLPKRVPSKPQHRAPFGVQTTSPAITTPAAVTAATDTGAERMRSLFEPVIPAESSQQNEVLPPPHRLHSTESQPRPSTPGPFGPGSAMPLPGGASPSPEFTVKASVTALRYCTPESPQFGKTVAEVWFRSAADAERVGFRPVG